ncbi:Transmembrane exosortase [Rubripirellula obstinata]|uniref:Transmembrane exosortase n=2 Tax=Rubripirellula obstinata TaxID=406547 RepID=A0A5B1CHX7_9BACT|nr:Transmembrane exosortase [Rubripirellula obstinata]
MLVALLPFLVKYCRAMWFQSLYQYFPFLLAAVFGLAYVRFDRRIRLPHGWFSKTATIASLIFMVGAAILASSWLGAIAFALATGGFLSAQRDHAGNSLGYLAVPMLMFIRAPLLGTYTVMHRLQLATTYLGSTLLDVLGVIHVKSGNTIELVNKSLFVAEACSGVQSLFTMCFLTLLLWAYKRRPYFLVPVYLLFAFFFAVVGNVIRVTSIAVAEAWFSFDLTEGLTHELVGYAALAIAAGMMASLDHVLGLMLGKFRPTGKQTSPSDDPISRFGDSHGFDTDSQKTVASANTANQSASNEAAASDFNFKTAFNQLPKLAKFAFVTSLACGAMMTAWMLLREPDKRPVVAKDEVLFEPKANFLSGLDAPIQVVNHEHRRDAHADRNARHGMNSDAWQCGINATQGQFALSQPYMGWHELTVCYRVLDWKLVARTPTMPTSGSDPVVVAEFTNDSGEHGTLFFTAVDSDGSIPRAPGHSNFSRSLAPLEPLIFDDFAELTGSAQTIMLQYWVTGTEPLSSETKQQVIDMMDQIRGYTSEQVAEYTDDLLGGS